MDEAMIHDLIVRARGGDTNALSSLLEHFRPRIRCLVKDSVGSDLAQETLLYATQHFREFEGATAGRLMGWFRMILRHKQIDGIRANNADKRGGGAVRSLDELRGQPAEPREPESKGPSPIEQARRAEDAARLGEALNKLPPRQALAVRLKHLEGWPLDELADYLDCTTAAAAQLVARGMRGLRRRLKPDEAEANR
jgi:RNA polymerase sigma-70 factor (ECF subfamily)